MDYVIETRGLTKKYGEKIAVNQVFAHVKKGDIYGLIGKNGAGKTTLMKLILGLALPNAGEMRLFGNSDLDAGRKKIGSLIEAPALFKNESAFENMKRFSYLAPTSDDEIKRLLDFVGIGNTGNKKVGSFSLGMKQRLGIAIALLGNPELLILDEPINGLDPAGIKEVRDLIVDLNHKGITFMISSHILDELGKIATTYGIVNEGVLEEISAEDLRNNCRSALKIVVGDAVKATAAITANFPDAEFTVSDNMIEITSEVKDASVINKALVKADVAVYEIANEKVEFEDYFIARLGK
ncbi:MAG: ATP-binding cassette domain-containing protein [Clostridia bacterium]|nr:ATP-binding cassette domain-containing protein [Clostridia bacterium]